jgi:hypothetical protein
MKKVSCNTWKAAPISRVMLRGSMRSGGKTCTGAGALFTCKSLQSNKKNKYDWRKPKSVGALRLDLVDPDNRLTGTDNKSSHDKTTNVKKKIFFLKKKLNFLMLQILTKKG